MRSSALTVSKAATVRAPAGTAAERACGRVWPTAAEPPAAFGDVLLGASTHPAKIKAATKGNVRVTFFMVAKIRPTSRRVHSARRLQADLRSVSLHGMSIPLIDPFLRPITYLRVSVTDRCDFRCVYCMSENMTFLPKKELLTLEELDRMCSTFIGMGVEKLRITGGEPLVRKEIMTFFQGMTRHLESGALQELTLTTNGSQLERFAQPLWDAGVRRVNISLDTLDETKFAEITRWGRLPQVLRGIDAAQKAGMRVKINTVALKGFNEDELLHLTEWCAERDMDLTWIEVMPMGDIGNENRLGQYWALSELRETLGQHYTLIDLPERTGGPARYVQLKETGQKIGFITPLSHNFCESCNRVRLTCTGELFMCLGQEDNADLRSALRNHPDNDAALQDAIRDAIAHKPKGHDFDYSRQALDGQMTRHMSHTGG
jgi:cyclic pyranopterin phosphate synthase